MPNRSISNLGGLKHDSVADHLLVLQVRNLLGLSVSEDCCMESGRTISDRLIHLPENSHRLCCVLRITSWNNNPLQC